MGVGGMASLGLGRNLSCVQPALRAEKDLAKTLAGEKIAETTTTHHEDEATWEIPGQFFLSCEAFHAVAGGVS